MELHSASRDDKFQRCCSRCVTEFVDTDEPLSMSMCCECDMCCERIVFFFSRPFPVSVPVEALRVVRANLGHFFLAAYYCEGPRHTLTDHTLDLPVDVPEKKRACYRQALPTCKLCMRQNEIRLLVLRFSLFCKIDLMHFDVETVGQFYIFPPGMFSSWGRP